jgi:hypothetical protein
MLFKSTAQGAGAQHIRRVVLLTSYCSINKMYGIADVASSPDSPLVNDTDAAAEAKAAAKAKASVVRFSFFVLFSSSSV